MMHRLAIQRLRKVRQQVELYLKRLENMYYHFPHKYHQQAQAQYTFTFGLAINGTASTDGAMTTALHQNNATVVTSRTQIFTVAANDYLEVNYMIDNTAGFLNYTAASSPVPAIPSSTLSITRTHA